VAAEKLAEPNSYWCDLGGGETRDDVMRLALRETVEIPRAELGPAICNLQLGLA
jgi:hypothetical protein